MCSRQTGFQLLAWSAALAAVVSTGCSRPCDEAIVSPNTDATPVEASRAAPLSSEMKPGWGVYATLWMRSAAEYHAVTRSMYAAAEAKLRDMVATAAASAENNANAKPLAVVLDVDETVLDNVEYEWRLAQSGEEFSPATWDLWVAERSASAVPGALEYIKAASELGVSVFYITNRKCVVRNSDEACPQEADTIANLVSLGFPQPTTDNMILRAEREAWKPRDKSPRRAWVMEQYKVVQMFGDSLGDFVELDGELGVTERKAAIDEHAARWGVEWFMFPNPSYGHWKASIQLQSKSNKNGG